MSTDQPNSSLDGPRQSFATTQWSVVLAAGDRQSADAQQALSQLCETYWYPLYAYVRRRVASVDEAQDLTQAFFSHLLEKDAISRAQPDRGRFRAFLLTALKNFLANQWTKEQAEKRGGGRAKLSLDFGLAESRLQIEPFHELTPEKLFERRWVLTLLNRVLESLQTELAHSGKQQYFQQLRGALTGEITGDDYQRAGEALGITPAAAKQAAYRMRKRYREMFRQEVARTTAREEDVDDEMRRLLHNLT